MKEIKTAPTTSTPKRGFQLSCHAGAVLIAVMMLCLIGCSRRYSDYPVYTPIDMEDYENHGVGRFKSSYLADQIDHYYRGTNPGPIGVATFVNVDDLYSTSTFGRMYAEQVMSELAMRSYDVVELRHADALQFLVDAGEFALSRDVAMVKRARDLGGIVVGTYAVSPVRVYVNARLIDPASSIVLAAGSVEMSKSQEIARLLRGGAFPATLERIPVKHLGMAAFPFNPFNPQHQSQGWDAEEMGASVNIPPSLIEPQLKAAPGAK